MVRAMSRDMPETHTLPTCDLRDDLPIGVVEGRHALVLVLGQTIHGWGSDDVALLPPL